MADAQVVGSLSIQIDTEQASKNTRKLSGGLDKLRKSIEKTWGELYYDVNIKTAPQRAFRITHGIKSLVFVLTSFLLRENTCLQI